MSHQERAAVRVQNHYGLRVEWAPHSMINGCYVVESRAAGHTAAECEQYIRRNWTDLCDVAHGLRDLKLPRAL